jgi:hypothetical protein
LFAKALKPVAGLITEDGCPKADGWPKADAVAGAPKADCPNAGWANAGLPKADVLVDAPPKADVPPPPKAETVAEVPNVDAAVELEPPPLVFLIACSYAGKAFASAFCSEIKHESRTQERIIPRRPAQLLLSWTIRRPTLKHINECRKRKVEIHTYSLMVPAFLAVAAFTLSSSSDSSRPGSRVGSNLAGP